MKKLILLFTLVFANAQNIVCYKIIKSEGIISNYKKYCIEHREYIGIGYDSNSMLASTNVKCECIPYARQGLFGDDILHKFKEIK